MRLRTNIAAVAGILLVGSAIVLPTAAAVATPLPEMTYKSFKVCEATSGVGVVHPSSPSKPQPVDENVSVYVGGSFTRSQGSELEGQLVVNGNATLVAGGDYNMGYVGGGSGIVPVAGQDLVRVGGDFTLGGASKARVSSIAADGQLLPGNVGVGGAATPESQILLEAGGTFTENQGRVEALGPVFANWPTDDFAVLRDFAARNQTGTPGEFSFADKNYFELTGTAGADRHLFTIPADQIPAGKADLKLVNIDPTDITVIQVTGATAKLNIENVYLGARQLIMWDFEFGQISARTLWTFPDATEVTIAGGQVPGSVVVPSAHSTTRMEAAGANGRYWVAGDLTQHRGGSEFQAFPFLGDEDSSCGSPSTPEVVVPDSVVPIAPAVAHSVCEAGKPSAPVVTLAADTGTVTYSKSGAEAAGSTVTVTAKTQGDSLFESTVSGWTISQDRKTATQSIVLTTPDCATVPVVPVAPTAVAPVTPTLKDCMCVGGKPTAPQVILAKTAGVTYELISGKPIAGSTATVKATAAKGYELTSVAGWVLAGDKKSATTALTLPAAEDCGPGKPKPVEPKNPKPAETPKPKPAETVKPVETPAPLVKPAPANPAAGGATVPADKALAATGGDPLPFWVLGGGVAAVIAGAALFVMRRRSQDDAQL